MNPANLQDRVSKALGAAARALGGWADAYRPDDPADPLAPTNRYLRLPAAFTAPDGRFGRPNPYGSALWHGIFDSAYTKPGDYIVQNDDTWFIAAQQHLLPVLCVKAARIVSFVRPAAPSAAGVNTYGGVTIANTTPLLTHWPASVLGAAGGAQPDADLPSDANVPYWTVLLPAYPGITLLNADLMTDDLGRTGVVAAAELTDLGWRLSVKQSTT
jgi:hypothetical protein